MVVTDRPYLCAGILPRRDRIGFVCKYYPLGWSYRWESTNSDKAFNQTQSWKGTEIFCIL